MSRVLVFSVCCIFLFSACKKKKRADIVANPAYAIGIVIKYTQAYNPNGPAKYSSPANVVYNFYIGTATYGNNYMDGFYQVPDDGVKKGDQYMVIYQKDKPDNNIMLFHYPVKDSSDYNNYINLFLTESPEF